MKLVDEGTLLGRGAGAGPKRVHDFDRREERTALWRKGIVGAKRK